MGMRREYIPTEKDYTSKEVTIDGIIYKRKKHPEAPKKPLNAYQLFINRNKNNFKQLNAKEKINTLASKWKTLNTSDRSEFHQKAEQLKTIYIDEKNDYIGPKYMYI